MFDLKSPLSVQLELTNQCNLRCTHCYNYWKYSSPDKIVLEKYSLDHFLSIANKLLEWDIFDVTLTGGEPFLRKSVLYTLARSFHDNNVGVSINSNLTLINEEDVVSLIGSGINSVLVSLLSYDENVHDSTTGVNGSHRKTLNGLKIINNKVHTAVNMVVSASNVTDVYSTGVFLNEDYNLSSFCATPASPACLGHKSKLLSRSQVKSTLDQLLDLKKDFSMNVDVLEPVMPCTVDYDMKYAPFFKRRCSAGYNPTVGVSGEIRACSHCDISYGNILFEDTSTLWKNLAPWRVGQFFPSECSGCMSKECNGGCRMYSKVINGSLSSAHPLMSVPTLDEHFALSEDKVSVLPYFSSNIRFRREAENQYLIKTNRSVLVVDEVQLSIIAYIVKNQLTDPEQVVAELNLDKGFVEDLFNILTKRGILI